MCNKLDLEIKGVEYIRSRRDYNKYEIIYPIHFVNASLKQYLLIETVFMVKAYPSEVKYASSMIYDYLKEINRNDLIEKFELEPFPIKVQSLERTFIDKVFALCDYSISNKIRGHSRHIYDLYKLYPLIKFDEKFKMLVLEVRESRKVNDRCYSVKDGANVNELLRKIVDDKIYYKDFLDKTKNILYEEVTYEICIATIDKIINDGMFIF